MNYTMGYDDKYRCVDCNEYYEDHNILIKSEWRCPKCGKHIHIVAPELNGGHIIIRKKVTELKQDDLIHIHGKMYIFIELRKVANNNVKLVLKKYGSMIAKETDYVDVIVGASK